MKDFALNRWTLAVLLTTPLLPWAVASTAPAQETTPQPLRAGMIGLDTSHVPAFAKLFNDPKATGDTAGIHGLEPLFTLMGTGCETVARVQAKDADVITGMWQDGRVGTYRGIKRHKAEFGAVAFGTKGIAPAGKSGGYEELCREIGKFFKTRQPPVSATETIEILAFMEAADESKRQGGKPVALKEVLVKARAQAASKH